MSLQYITGDITTVKEGFIIQGVNCQGVMGSGIAKAIRDKWPIVYDEYEEFCEGKSSSELLGSYHIVSVEEQLAVVNVFSQNQYGRDGYRYAKPEAIKMALTSFFNYLTEAGYPGVISSAKIGCGLGGLKWETDVKPIFENLMLELQPEFQLFIYDNRK